MISKGIFKLGAVRLRQSDWRAAFRIYGVQKRIPGACYLTWFETNPVAGAVSADSGVGFFGGGGNHEEICGKGPRSVGHMGPVKPVVVAHAANLGRA